jgi:hypothetical protein
LKRKSGPFFYKHAGKLPSLLVCACSGFISACFLFAVFGSMSWGNFWYLVGMGALVVGLTLFIAFEKQ